MDERIPYEEFLTNMIFFNDEQHLIVNDIIYIFKKTLETFTHFLKKRCKNKKNFYITCQGII
jgi:hypothetical protein